MTKPLPVRTKQLTFEDTGIVPEFFGEHGANLKRIEEFLGVSIQARGNQVTITGETPDIELGARACEELYGLVESGFHPSPRDVDHALRILQENPEADLKGILLDKLFIHSGKRIVTPKGIAQKEYTDAIRNHDVVFAIGPAGTGKTYLAMAMAVSFLLRDEIKRIILTRPAVEAGERLGFLPGDLAEKVNPYLRPLYDALYDMLAFDRVANLIERRVIEVAPLAFMRGRTLNDAFIILDEAQNTTSEQMKMFLTRLGYRSKAVITGDVTQIDLPDKRASGLVEAARVLRDIPGIAFVTFTKKDVVRHKLVSRIIQAYEEREKERGDDTH